MSYDPYKHRRRSIRLKAYDYTQAGAYFVTMCTRNRERLFGRIVDGEMHLNQHGRIVAGCWEWLSKQYAYADIDEWVIMPNHLHGIIGITDGDIGPCRGGSRTAPTSANRKPLGHLIGAFKTISTNASIGFATHLVRPSGSATTTSA